jgi:hypothetical protein
MKTTTMTARRLLRESNPVPEDAFAEAAHGRSGQARLAAILDRQVTSPASGGTRGRGRNVRQRPVRLRSRWRVAFPAAALSAALAGGLATALVLTGEPGPGAAARAGQSADSGFVSLVADLTAHPAARAGDAAGAFRRLAEAAAAQPSPRGLGPVEFTETKIWGLDVGAVHYGLSYRSHDIRTDQNWMGSDGSSLTVSTYPGGKIPPGIIPVQRSGPSKQGEAYFAWFNPARLPAGEAALRQHLLNMPGASPPGCRPGQFSKERVVVPEVVVLGAGGNAVALAPSSCPDPTGVIMGSSLALLGGEPLPSAVRASLLRVLADTAVTSGPRARFIDMGTVTDRAGHTGIAIGYETPAGTPDRVSLQVLIFDVGTGALLGQEYATCNGQVGSQPADGSCVPASYFQFLQIKAVSAVPATPVPSPTDSVVVPPRGFASP